MTALRVSKPSIGLGPLSFGVIRNTALEHMPACIAQIVSFLKQYPSILCNFAHLENIKEATRREEKWCLPEKGIGEAKLNFSVPKLPMTHACNPLPIFTSPYRCKHYMLLMTISLEEYDPQVRQKMSTIRQPPRPTSTPIPGAPLSPSPVNQNYTSIHLHADDVKGRAEKAFLPQRSLCIPSQCSLYWGAHSGHTTSRRVKSKVYPRTWCCLQRAWDPHLPVSVCFACSICLQCWPRKVLLLKPPFQDSLQLACFSGAWGTLCDLGAFCGKPSEKVWCLDRDAHKKDPGLSFFSLAKCDKTGEHYAVVESNFNPLHSYFLL